MLVLLIPTTVYDLCDCGIFVVALKLLIWKALFLVVPLLRVQGIVIVGVRFLVRIENRCGLRRLCRPAEYGPIERGNVVEEEVVEFVVLPDS